MEKNIIRLLRAEEIECRVSIVKDSGVSLLLYKDARVDQRILDEVFGIFGWQRRHEAIEGNLYCTVAVFDKETGQWISKQDVGTSGISEQEKSQASDSFKRACFNIGIGRELYSAPFIWVSREHVDIQKRGEKLICVNRFSVAEIAYSDSREIEHLVIANERGDVVYRWELKKRQWLEPAGMSSSPKAEKTMEPKEKEIAREEKKDRPGERKNEPAEKKDGQITKRQIASLEKELNRTGVKKEQVTERYKVDDFSTMSEDTYQRIMRALAVTEPKAKEVA